MVRLARRLWLATLALIVLLVACSPTPTPSTSQTAQADPTPTVAVVPAAPGFESWEDVLAQARGSTVNWYLWGGSAAINEFVDTHYGDVLQAEFEIALNRVPVADTVDAVNLVLSEAEAGVTEGGAAQLCAVYSFVRNRRAIGSEFDQSSVATATVHHIQAQRTGHHVHLKAIRLRGVLKRERSQDLTVVGGEVESESLRRPVAHRARPDLHGVQLSRAGQFDLDKGRVAVAGRRPGGAALAVNGAVCAPRSIVGCTAKVAADGCHLRPGLQRSKVDLALFLGR